MADGPRSFWAATFTDLSSWPGFCALAVQQAHHRDACTQETPIIPLMSQVWFCQVLVRRTHHHIVNLILVISDHYEGVDLKVYKLSLESNWGLQI